MLRKKIFIFLFCIFFIGCSEAPKINFIMLIETQRKKTKSLSLSATALESQYYEEILLPDNIEINAYEYDLMILKKDGSIINFSHPKIKDKKCHYLYVHSKLYIDKERDEGIFKFECRTSKAIRAKFISMEKSTMPSGIEFDKITDIFDYIK